MTTRMNARMSAEKKKRINALDVIIVLAVLASIVAFFLRGRIISFFTDEASGIVTYSFTVTDVETETAAYLAAGQMLYGESGEAFGKVLSVTQSAGTDTLMLTDGHAVEVQNGKTDLVGTVTAIGYGGSGFVYLADGTLLIPGGTLCVTTGGAVFTLQITDVQIIE